MASAGVVGMADVVVPNSTVTGSKMSGSVAMWSFIWVGGAILFLVFVHLAMVGRAGR